MIVFLHFSFFFEKIGRNSQKCALFNQDQKCVPDGFDFRDFGIDKQGDLCIEILNAPDLQFVGNECRNKKVQVNKSRVFTQSCQKIWRIA